MPNSDYGYYSGTLMLEPLDDGRRMRVVREFGFVEPDHLHWRVPTGTIVDGASIPRPLWSVIGGPFEGKYRNASVVHDYYCDVRSAEWKVVHRMFYRGMLASDVPLALAKLMYAAVYFGGPRWSITVVENVTLATPAVPKRLSDDLTLFRISHDKTTLALSRMLERGGRPVYELIETKLLWSDASSEVTLDLGKLAALIETENPSISKLESALDEALQFVPTDENTPRSIHIGKWVEPL